MVKKAVLVGCNYPGTSDELQGCVNDVKAMYEMLVGKFGFVDEDVTVLVPTGSNIQTALNMMVQGAQPGDTFFFHFSGHGTRIPVDAGEVDDTGFDECICPCDCHFIEDDAFREIISKLPSGTTFTIVSDSCQSGGLIDQAKEQIGNSFEQLTMAEVAPDPLAGKEGKKPADGGGEQKIIKKGLSAEAMVQMLRKQSGREDIEVSNLRSMVWDMFGKQASSKVKKQAKGISNTGRSVSGGQPSNNRGKAEKKRKVVTKKKKNDSSSSSSSSDEGDEDNGSCHDIDEETADTYEKESRDLHGEGDDEEEGDDAEAGHEDEAGDDEEEVDDNDQGDANDDNEESRGIDDEIDATYTHVESATCVDGNVGVLVSGCQSHQTSADVLTDPPHGALTNGIITVLQMLEPGEPITNRQLVRRIRRYLASHGYTQEPGLYCTDEKADQPFICQPIN